MPMRNDNVALARPASKLQSKELNVLKQRIITALWLVPLALIGFFYLQGVSYAMFIGAVIALGAWEWAALAGIKHQLGRVSYALVTCLALLLLYTQPMLAEPLMLMAMGWWLLAIVMVISYPASVKLWGGLLGKLLIGWLILLPAWQGLLILKQWPQANTLILMLMVLIWSADIGAYFTGKTFGKRKLAPRVSPGKSWEGAIGGAVISLLVASLFAQKLSHLTLSALQILLMMVPVVVLSIIGDLTESMFKRQSGIKDSSNLLPGHGGILDRIDSLTAAVPVFVVIMWVAGWGAL